MAKPADRDPALLLDMLLAARDARDFVAGKVSPALRAAQPAIPWREITGMRHRLIHGYDEVELDVVWRVVTVHLEPLIASLEPLIEQEGPPDA
jgi:uncharacterized protein with HEPN domain